MWRGKGRHQMPGSGHKLLRQVKGSERSRVVVGLSSCWERKIGGTGDKELRPAQKRFQPPGKQQLRALIGLEHKVAELEVHGREVFGQNR